MADALPLYVVLISGIPQTFFILLLGFQLFNDPIPIKKVLIISILGSFVNYLIRYMNVMFGIHTLATVVALILFCYFLTKKEIWKVASAVICGMVVFVFFEWLYVLMLRTINQTVLNQPQLYSWLEIILAIPPTVIICILYLITKKCKFFLFNSTHFEIKRHQ